MKTLRLLLTVSAATLFVLTACRHEEYDMTRGIDKEVTLFADEISLPVGDLGPLTPKMLLDKAGLGDMLTSLVKQDDEGYLIVEQKEGFYSEFVMMIAMGLADQSIPATVQLGSFSKSTASAGATLRAMGLSFSPQVLRLYATNPLTEDMSVSGKMTLYTDADGSQKSLVSKDFSNAKLGAGTTDSEFFQLEYAGDEAVDECRMDDLALNLPASILTKDPLAGFSPISFSYHYKGFLSLGSDFPISLPFSINDKDLPLGQYRVKEATIRADVSSEIPITIELESVQLLAKQTDEDGNSSTVTLESVSVTPGIRIMSGCTGHPATTPLEIVVKAQEGTIPDICGASLSLRILAPTGVSDKRIGMNQTVNIHNLRATVSGGITVQGL